MEEKKITTMLQAVDAITKNAKDSDIGEDFVKKMKHTGRYLRETGHYRHTEPNDGSVHQPCFRQEHRD